MALTSQSGIEDCMAITRAFEKGAAHAMTEESVFAMFSSRLSTMRSMAKATKRSMAAKASETKDPALLGLVSGDADVQDLLRECFPCKLRINFKGQLDIASLLDPTNALNEFADKFWGALETFMQNALNEILQIIDMFRNLDKYVDLCAFRKFFTEFVCIPDLSRILALLTAFLMKLALEINSIFGLIVALFGPLLLPFLTGIVDQLTQFIMAAIKPIECVIENLQLMLTKLDYNVLFENMTAMNLENSGVFKTPDQKDLKKTKEVKIPLIGTLAVNADARGNPAPSILKADPNPPISANGGSALLSKDNSKVLEAQKKLANAQQASAQVDGSDAAATAASLKQVQDAKAELAQAESERDLSAIGRTNQKITEVSTSLKGSLVSMLATLRRAAAEIEAYIRKVVNELQKLMEEFTGGGQAAFSLLADKLQVIQLMALIVAIINALKNKQKCEDEGQEVETFTNLIDVGSGFNIWTDDNGDIHIEEGDEGVKAAIEDVVKVFGVPPDADPRQKLKSMVKFTGDDTLDSSISRAVDALTTPAKVKFKCPLQTSVASAEQVNKWIKELNSESV